MGKFLESIGLIEGYDIITIGKMKAKKDKLFEEIKKYDSNVKEETRKIVNESSGLVFAIVKKGTIKGIYLFISDSKNDTKVLKHIKTVFTDEISTDIREKYDIFILNKAKEYVLMQEYDKIILNDKVVQIDPKLTKKDRNLAWIGGFIIGFALGWIIFDEFYLGLVYGVIFAPVFGGLEVVITNKRGRKKKNDK